MELKIDGVTATALAAFTKFFESDANRYGVPPKGWSYVARSGEGCGVIEHRKVIESFEVTGGGDTSDFEPVFVVTLSVGIRPPDIAKDDVIENSTITSDTSKAKYNPSEAIVTRALRLLGGFAKKRTGIVIIKQAEPMVRHLRP